jgi:uncharacterized membrane protein
MTFRLSFSAPNVTLAAAIGAGLSAGVFFAFSTFVMRALGKLPDAQGLAAMQRINDAAPNPLFMLVWLGTAALCVGIAISGVRRWDAPEARWQVAGAVLYLAMIVLSFAYHIPQNDALGRLDPSAAGSAQEWRSYLTNWTAWNHVRTITSAAGAVALTIGYRLA